MKVVVLGLGVSGKALVTYLLKRGDQIVGVDRAVHKIPGVHYVSESDPIQLSGVDLVVKSPGVPLTHPWVEAASAAQIPLVGEIDLAFSELRKRNKRVLGITGSNGKTTTTLMAAHLLTTSGKKAAAVGNVGIPLISQIDSPIDVFVVELSSFQLEQVVSQPVLDRAVILNITVNHLDRHLTFEDYMQAKFRIVSCLKAGGTLLVSKQVAPMSPFPYTIFDEEQEKIETILPLGYRDSLYPHDLENLSAAYALTGVPEEALKNVATFVRPPHRLEFVCHRLGVRYINDSKATSVDAVIKAVQALQGPVILIAGGVDKGGAFADWLPHFRGKVVRVIALGAASKRIEKELSPEIKVNQVSSLEECVSLASEWAVEGDTILLSPGCSSYDQFRDYEHRGESFMKIVKGMI